MGFFLTFFASEASHLQGADNVPVHQFSLLLDPNIFRTLYPPEGTLNLPVKKFF